jgi:undecaprenyl-diphosphatase
MLNALLLGIVEGLTEFLPVSSTAHLIITSKFLNLSNMQYWNFFEVFIQAGAILAVATIYFQQAFNLKLIKNIIFSFVPTALVGFFLYSIIKTVFFNSDLLIAVSLILFGIIFLILEKAIAKGKIIINKELIKLDFWQAVIIGLAQSLAVVPGVSRAGAVLVAGLLLGYKREQVALYSFLLAVPTILAAAIFDLLKTDWSVVSSNIVLTLVGFVSAYLSALVVIKWFIGFLQKNNLRIFGYYRIVVGLLILASLLV